VIFAVLKWSNVKKFYMKKTILLFIFGFLAVSSVNAQTKKIALESHSGKKSEFKIDGEGNFGEPMNPIVLAEMNHYYDSLRKADSVKNVAVMRSKQDSAKKADSLQKAKQLPGPKKSKPKRAIGIQGAAYISRPKKGLVASK